MADIYTKILQGFGFNLDECTPTPAKNSKGLAGINQIFDDIDDEPDKEVIKEIYIRLTHSGCTDEDAWKDLADQLPSLSEDPYLWAFVKAYTKTMVFEAIIEKRIHIGWTAEQVIQGFRDACAELDEAYHAFKKKYPNGMD